MARYTGPRSKICRRLEFAAFESPKFGNPRKNYPPGQHGMSRRRKLSNYGIQLREKQRMKYLYEVLEKQFRNYYKKAQSKSGPTGENLVILLESRLDNSIYRMGLASTRRSARQLVVHKHFLVNNRVVNIPSFQLSPGDVVSVRDKSKKMEVFQESLRRIKGDNPTDWLSLNKAKLSGSFISYPERAQVEEPFDEQLVIELYSK
ncbi:MAG: 30S ribosomal protein S4 [Candidatus Marinimicrobia bacterium]|nr:30S ribosomal protein S4 [Candidatus Neomarinimicrobiota bacterium]|tara:strand:+ start:1877 stop:2488 length:612 start_codon:yes stop_codon:yes gene_type:complete